MENARFTKFDIAMGLAVLHHQFTLDIAMGLAVLHHQFTLQALLTKPTPTPIITNGKY